MSPTVHRRLSDILIEQELINESQLADAIAEQKRTGLPLSRVLVALGLVSEEDIVVALSEQLGIPHIRVENYNTPPEVIEEVPETLARQYVLIPISKTGDTLTVAMSDPLNIMALDDLKMLTGRNIEVMVSPASEINAAIDKCYRGKGADTAEQAIYETLQDKAEEEQLEVVAEKELDLGKLKEEAQEAPIIQLANLILVNAIEAGASDIHIEPFEKELRIRYRVDGVLKDVKSPPKSVHAALASRFKIMGDLDIAEHRLPQDGRFRIRYKGREIDFRQSSLPTYHGEKIVIRILDKEQLTLDIEKLGFEEQPLQAFLEAIKRPYGLILLSGPTGSGKTTTLYATLHKLNVPDINIVTVEDPIEYELFGISQVQAHPEIGLTFAAGLRSILRQDPDVVMVGEMRDEETADIAIKSALTGHLVLSTVHANDAPSVVTRLLDMGMEPFLVASSLVAAAAQRLMRRVCPDCKEPVQPPPEALAEIQFRPKEGETPAFVRGHGCKKCNATGYRGRLAVIEVMLNATELEELVVRRAPAPELKRVALKLGMSTLRQNALAKAARGLTTIDEVLRVTPSD